MIKMVFVLLLVSAISTTISAQKRHVVSAIDSLIALNQAAGSVLIFDPEADSYYSNDFLLSEKGSLPASIFKIPNVLIALETGVASLDTI